MIRTIIFAENAWSAWGESKIFTLIYVGSKRPPTIDVLGHEYTHAVERSISHLEGKGETGALMEAYGDIMGKLLQTGIITHLKQYIRIYLNTGILR